MLCQRYFICSINEGTEHLRQIIIIKNPIARAYGNDSYCFYLIENYQYL